MSLDAACFGARPEGDKEMERQRAFVIYLGRYGEPEGEVFHVPLHAAYKPGDRVMLNGQKAVVLRHDRQLGICEVVYAKSGR